MEMGQEGGWPASSEASFSVEMQNNKKKQKEAIMRKLEGHSIVVPLRELEYKGEK